MLEKKINTSYATLSSGIPWNIPRVTRHTHELFFFTPCHRKYGDRQDKWMAHYRKIECNTVDYITCRIILAFLSVLTYDLLEDRRMDDVIEKSILFLYYIKQIDSIFPRVCSVIDHRRWQNVVKTSVTHSTNSSYATFLFASVSLLNRGILLSWVSPTW